MPVCDAREHGKTLEKAILDAQKSLLGAMNSTASVETTNDANTRAGDLLKDKRSVSEQASTSDVRLENINLILRA